MPVLREVKGRQPLGTSGRLLIRLIDRRSCSCLLETINEARDCEWPEILAQLISVGDRRVGFPRGMGPLLL
jgi:hypothetical protein